MSITTTFIQPILRKINILSDEELALLRDEFLIDGIFNARCWRNAKKPNVDVILAKLDGGCLSEKIFNAFYERPTCIVCGNLTSFGTATSGYKVACSRRCAQLKISAHKSELKKNYWKKADRLEISTKMRTGKRKGSLKKLEEHREILKDRQIDCAGESGGWKFTHVCGYSWKTTHLRIPPCCPRCYGSKEENEVFEFLKNNVTTELRMHDRKVIYPKEIDIFVPEHRLGVEYNGAWWHRDKNEQEKVLLGKEAGIRIFNILQSDWISNRDKVKRKLLSYINPLVPVYARKLQIKETSTKEAKDFCEKYHFSGYASSSEKYGLYDGNELIMLCTFGPSRFEKENWELIRMCGKDNLRVIGGLEKIISHWRKSHAERLVTYHDLRFGWSNVYKNAGFAFVSVTRPGYRWVNRFEYLERGQTQKSKLEKLLGEDIDLTKTEDELMVEAGWIKEHNCGNSKWILN